MNSASTPNHLPPKTPDFLPELLRFRPRRRRRTDKIARLPSAIRVSLNHMLDEGLPYKEIILKLGEHGKNLSKQNISRWKQGAYQDHLNDQQLAEHNRLQMEYAADSLGEITEDSPQIAEACNRLAALQMFAALRDGGGALLSKSLNSDPLNFLRLCDTICRQANVALQAKKLRLLTEGTSSSPSPMLVPTAPGLEERAGERRV